jgi:ketosteroid isomerase-like protein
MRMTPDGATAWLREYAASWERGDGGALDLFTPDATYQSQPFRDTHVGYEGIRAYWDGATSTQGDVRVRLGGPLVEGDRVVAEWWTTMTDEARPLTLPGVLLLDFDGGRCRALREYWAEDASRSDPFPGWGRFEGAGGPAHAAAWTEAYAEAWRAGDADAAAALYADDVGFRSHPFRDPVHGREAVRAYTAKAFGAEHDRVVRMGRPLAAGGGAAVEYWTTYTEDGTPQTLAGCVLMSFDDQGAVVASRDYWHVAEGTFEPPPGWGWRR